MVLSIRMNDHLIEEFKCSRMLQDMQVICTASVNIIFCWFCELGVVQDNIVPVMEL